MNTLAAKRGLSREQGVTSIAVMGLLLLASGGLLSGWWAQIQDQQLQALALDRLRTQQAAEALLRDAEQDVLQPAGRAAQASPWPWTRSALMQLRAELMGPAGARCAAGLCAPPAANHWPARHWRELNRDDAFWASGARHGQFPGASTSDPLASALLAQGRYWVEVLLADSEDGVTDWTPTPEHPLVHRITAVAWGHRPGTQVVLQSLWVMVPQRAADPDAEPDVGAGASTTPVDLSRARRVAWREVFP